MTVVYLRTKYAGCEQLRNVKTIFTIHNIEYQGKFDPYILGNVFALDEKYKSILEYDGCLNLMKGAIVCADRVNTVSPNYANELRHAFFACGLQNIINMYAYKICGVINGIDTVYFSPDKGGDIQYPFDATTVTEGKAKNKLALQRELGLPENADIPLIVMITRLTHAKGIDLVLRIFEELMQENVQFVLLCLGVTAAVVLLAWGSEKLVMKKRHRLNTAHTITTVGMLAAISGVLMVIELPLFFAPPFYKLDFSELPVLICAFSLGPVAGVVCEFLKVLIHLLLKGTSTAFVGDLANFLVGCSFVLPASILYQKLLSKKGAVASLALGTGVMTVFGSLFNAWFLIPRFAVMYGLPLDAIIAMGTQVNGAITDLSTLVLLAVVPFNLLKGVLVSVLTFFLYKRVERLFFRKKTAE